MKVGVVFGVSELANPKAFERKASEFLTNLAGEFDVSGGFFISTREDFREAKGEVNFNEVDALILYPLTGGTEGALREFSIYRRPVVIYGDPFNNSLAAGIELREYFRDRLIPARLVKNPDELKAVLLGYAEEMELLNDFLSMRLGLIGRVSPWLINERFELPYTRISLRKFYDYYEKVGEDEGWNAVEEIVGRAVKIGEPGREDLVKAGRIYLAIKRILRHYRLDGFTIGCFDLIGKLRATPCLALAMFNAEGVPAACEGELNALLGMMIVRRFFDESAFMGNVADYGENHLILAHCTAPLVGDYALRSHFESGIGVGVEVSLPKGRASLLKIRGRKAVVAHVEVSGLEHNDFRCRTQVRLRMEDAGEFVEGTLGNHHLLAYVEAEELAELLSDLGFEVMLY
ncbi:hypothetical protein A3L12_01990 [Thermococcus sp. P6]|uniref:hypothetical protein n=1 Tax=Thermococcus sp. P6 TaxID=122420 RepID=UPI000B598895|nr:hypothetical protein [Thermococcus sp. P6]ASJ10150.1 hypothetical protein A3L12_01990 [Thermococcus sp. P6]